jgi:aspartyl-tRNA(Asn)/glutamyl-tRNA(Gln) amidotransferase subunit C
MDLLEKHIEHLANLARLGISETEKKKYAEQMSAILEYFEQLKEVDTKGVEPMSHISNLSNVTRKDVVDTPFSQDKVLAEAPEIEKRQVKVPGVFSE